jgi:hypothetical protein
VSTEITEYLEHAKLYGQRTVARWR